MPTYPSATANPLYLNGGMYGMYSGWSPYMSMPYGAYPLLTTVFVPVYGRWPRPRPIYPTSAYPTRAYPPRLTSNVNGHPYPIGVQPVHPVAGYRPTATRPAAVAARPSGGIHAIGHR